MPFKKSVGYLLPILLLLGGILFYYLVDPESYRMIPKCPFRLLTGWDCPGCGSQRVVHALLHGRIGSAFAFNPLLVVCLPYLGTLVYLEYFSGKTRYPRWRTFFMGRTACRTAFIVVAAYWIGRNLFSFIPFLFLFFP